jgi:DNA-binding MarR family transcriptional regulator
MSALRAHLLGEGEDALDLGQVDTLDLLAQQGSCRMGDLAEVLRVDPSTATRAVDRLVEAGLADRRRSDEDARVVVVVLTGNGRALHDALTQRRRAAMNRILAGFSDGERRELADLLERLVAGVDSFVATEAALA